MRYVFLPTIENVAYKIRQPPSRLPDSRPSHTAVRLQDSTSCAFSAARSENILQSGHRDVPTTVVSIFSTNTPSEAATPRGRYYRICDSQPQCDTRTNTRTEEGINYEAGGLTKPRSRRHFVSRPSVAWF